MALKGDIGRGGARPVGRMLGGLDPNEIRGKSEIERYLEGGSPPSPAQAYGHDSRALDVAEVIKRYMPDGVAVRPSGFWSLGVLPSVDSTYVKRSWTQLYAGNGTELEIISTPVATPQGRVTIVTGFCFFATLPAVGGLVAGVGRLTLAADYDLYGDVSFNFLVPSGPSLAHWRNAVGSKANERGGIGFLNEGYDDSPVELYIPANTPLRATYNGSATPRVDPYEVGFKFQGYECDSKEFAAHISGTKR